MNSPRLRLAAGASILALMAMPAPAFAQDAAAPSARTTNDVITVTARKREEALSDIPTAVSVATAADIAQNDLDELEDVTLRIPGVQFTEQSTLLAGRARQGIRFRGMDTNLTAPSQQVGTAFLDGIYVSTGVQALDFGALERIEVIKGPQSALFGRNTFGGAINFITRDPAYDFGGEVVAELEDFGGYDASVRVEGALIDNVLAARLSLRGFGTQGQYRSVADGGRLGEEQTRSFNAVLLFEPTERLSMRFRAFYSEERDGQNDGVFIGSAASNFGRGPGLTNCNAIDPSRTGTGFTDYFCGDISSIVGQAGFTWAELANSTTTIPGSLIDLINGDTATESLSGVTRPVVSNVPFLDRQGQARDQIRLMASLNYAFGSGPLEGFELDARAGFSDVGLNWIRDFDYTAAPGWTDRDAFYDRDTSFEIRLSSPGDQRLRYSVGLNYIDVLHEERGATGVLAYDWLGELGAFGIGGPLIFYGQPPVEETSEAIGVFATAGFDITETVTLDVEARYQEDTIGQGDQFEATFTNFLPRITLSWDVTPGTLVWATYSEGNLPGFFNGAAVDLDAAELAQIEPVVGPISVFNDEEELINYEIGLRHSALNNQLNLAAVAYWMEWTNQKTRVGVPFIDSDTGTPRVIGLQTNAGNSELSGIEFEGDYAFSDRLTTSFSVNWAQSEYTEFTCSFAHYIPGHDSGRVPCEGNALPKYPEWSGAFAVRWEDQLRDHAGWTYYTQLAGTYFGKAYIEETNFSHYGENWRLDLRAGFQREGLRLEAFVTNLLDDDTPESAARSADFSQSSFLSFSNNYGIVLTPPEQRTFGVRTSVDF
jgi:iron complex outermembrane receptor protein